MPAIGCSTGGFPSRLSVKKRDELTEQQCEQFDRIARFRKPSPDGVYGGPFDPWLRSPELARRNIAMGNFLWERTSLDRRIVEFAICVTARFWRSNVEWVAHARTALQYGVTEETLDAIMDQRPHVSGADDEQLAYEVCSALHATHGLSRALYDRAVEGFGERGLVEIIAVIGYYTSVSMTLNTFEIEMPGVDTQPFERSAD